jgi:uncharacterized protein with HEPN domain
MRDRTRQCLEDMLENASQALRYRDEDRDGWRTSDLRVDAILRRVGVVGEAAARVPVADRARFPSIEWREIIGMRQHVVHGYDKIDLDILDGVLSSDLPNLVHQLEELLS